MKMTTQDGKSKKKQGRPPKNRKCEVPGCTAKHYAKGMCFNHWRKAKGYGTGGDRGAANLAYDKSEKGKERRSRVMQKRRTLKRITGVDGIQANFSNPEAIAKLRQALEGGDRDLATIWTWLSEEQQSLILPKQ